MDGATFTLAKPSHGEPGNGCGYCCTKEPCALAKDFLNCSTGPCVALEYRDGKSLCGLVRNPLGYLYKAVHPGDESVHVSDTAADIDAGRSLSAEFALALGVGRGCDAEDDKDSAIWPIIDEPLAR